MNKIFIPCCIIKNNIELYNKYNELVNINLKIINKLNINAEIIIYHKSYDNLRDMWYNIIKEIINLINNNNNVLYMEADTILFKNCDEIFNYDKILMFGLGYWNMNFKEINEFNFYEYWNSGLVYFPKNSNLTIIDNLYNNWPKEGDIIKLKEIFPNFNFNFGNRQLDYSGTYWEYMMNKLFYNQFKNKQEAIQYIVSNFGLWKYNYRGCLYNKYPYKRKLCDIKKVSHCHFLIYSSNKDKQHRFKDIINIFNNIFNLLDNTQKLNIYISSIYDNMF